MNTRYTARKFQLGLVILVVFSLTGLLAACAPAATPTPSAPAEPVVTEEAPVVEPTTPPEEPTTPPEEPTEVVTEAPPEEPAGKPTIIIALDSDIDHIEPMEFRSDAGYYATANLYEPLLIQELVPGDPPAVLEGTDQYLPGLGEVTMSEDGLTATVKIKEGATVFSGATIDANSFKHTFDRAMTAPRSYIPLLTQFMGITGPDSVVVVDDYTLEFHLEKPSALFVPFLAFQVFGAMDPATTAEHATAEDEWAFDWYRLNANPSGPYQITKWEPGVEYVFEPNPNYWQGPDYFQNSQVIVKVVPSPEDRELLLKKGDIDLALGLPFKDVDALKRTRTSRSLPLSIRACSTWA